MYKTEPEKAEKIADIIIKNTYRTLLTRGQKGCYIYCTDHNLSEYLKKRIDNIFIEELKIAESNIDYNK